MQSLATTMQKSRSSQVIWPLRFTSSWPDRKVLYVRVSWPKAPQIEFEHAVSESTRIGRVAHLPKHNYKPVYVGGMAPQILRSL